jgi:exopolysaccharide biosynthesis operon protein EpsL
MNRFFRAEGVILRCVNVAEMLQTVRNRVQSGFAITIATAIAMAIAAVGQANAVALPPPPTPEDGTTWDMYVADQETYDDNLFRLPSSFSVATLIAPNATRSDSFNTATAGGNGQWIFSQQAVNLNMHVDENRFTNNTQLNNTSGDARLNWDWRVGSYLSGLAGADYSRGLASFGETLYLGRDVVTSTDYFLNGKYLLGPRWSVYGGAEETDATHSAPAAQLNDFRTKVGNGGIEYASDINDTYRLEYRYTEGIYSQFDLESLQGVTFSPDFHESMTRFLVNYAITDKTSINGYVGYQKRTYPDASVGAFSGDIWRVTVQWLPTDKTQVAVATWHELHAFLASESDFFLSKGGSIAPTWTATEKITLSLVLSYEDQNYISTSPIAIALGSREDKVTGEQINLLYTPKANWYFNFFVRNSERKSNQSIYAYNDTLAQASVSYKFH